MIMLNKEVLLGTVKLYHRISTPVTGFVQLWLLTSKVQLLHGAS